MSHMNIQVNFCVGMADEPEVVYKRFLAILDRVMPADETMSAPRRLGGDGGMLHVDHWTPLEGDIRTETTIHAFHVDEDYHMVWHVDMDVDGNFFLHKEAFDA